MWRNIKMSLEKIRSILKIRIENSRKWAEEGFSEDVIEGFKIRSFPCQVKPVSFLDDEGRKERFGVQFRLSWEGTVGPAYSTINVRIGPEGTGESVGKGPYVSVYVLDKEGEEDLITWIGIHEKYIDTYKLNSDKSNQDFYKHFLNIIGREEWCSKIFQHKVSAR